MTSRPKCYLVMPYLVDYRVGVVDALAGHYGQTFQVVHPITHRDSSTKSVVSDHSITLPPARPLLGGRLYHQPKLLPLILRRKPRRLIVEAEVRCITYWGLMPLCALLRLRVCIWGLGIHSRDRAHAEGLLNRLVTSWLLLFVRGAVGKGNSAAAYYQKRSRRQRQRFLSAPNTTAVAEALGGTPLSIPAAPPPIRLLFAGRLTASKRADVAVRAAAQVAKDFPLHLTLAGQGPEKENLHKLITASGAPVTLQDRLSADELAKYLLDCHLVLMPGSGGLLAAEAMAAGRPLVTGELTEAGDGSLRDICVDGRTAFVAEGRRTGDAQAAYAAALLRAVRVAQDPVLFDEMAHDCKSMYQTKGGLAALVAALDSVLEV